MRFMGIVGQSFDSDSFGFARLDFNNRNFASTFTPDQPPANDTKPTSERIGEQSLTRIFTNESSNLLVQV